MFIDTPNNAGYNQTTWYPPNPDQAVQSNQNGFELDEISEGILSRQLHPGAFVSLPLNVKEPIKVLLVIWNNATNVQE